MRKFDTWSDQNQRLPGEQWYALLAHVIARACIDAISDDPLLSADALAWLNSENGRLCLGILGFTIAGAISPQDLRVPARNIYYNGSSDSFPGKRIWPAMTPAESEQRNVRGINTL